MNKNHEISTERLIIISMSWL